MASANYFASLDLEDDEVVVQKTTKGKTSEKPKAATKAAAPIVVAPAVSAFSKDAEDSGVEKPRRSVPEHGRGDRRPRAVGRNDREKDHHESGTGRGKEVSKSGAGARNWGNEKTEAREATEAKPEGAAEETVEAEPAQAEEVVEEEVDNTITFAQYEAQRASKRGGALFAVAKEDTSALLKQFDGAKKIARGGNNHVDDEFAFLGGKLHTKKDGEAAEESEEEEQNGAVDIISKTLLSFRVGGSYESNAASTERRGGRGGSRGGAARGDREPRAPRGDGEAREPRAPRGDGEAREPRAPRAPRAEGETHTREGRAPRGEGEVRTRQQGPRDGASRGGASRGRGGASRGGATSGSSSRGPRAVNVQDFNAFPSLGH